MTPSLKEKTIDMVFLYAGKVKAVCILADFKNFFRLDKIIEYCLCQSNWYCLFPLQNHVNVCISPRSWLSPAHISFCICQQQGELQIAHAEALGCAIKIYVRYVLACITLGT